LTSSTAAAPDVDAAPAATPQETSPGDVDPTRILVLIPAYNEEKTLGRVLTDLERVARGCDVLVVDDGSRDQTCEVARLHGAIVIRHPFNMGYGAALQTGYKYAAGARRYDVLVQMDGDGQHDPSFVTDLARRILEGEVDACVGSRFLTGEGYIPPFARRLGMVLFGYIASVVTGRRVTDPTSGYQALSRRVFEFFQTDLFPTDYPDADMLILLHQAGFRVEERSVAMRASTTGQSMHSGILKPMFYVFKMLLSIGVTLLREPPPRVEEFVPPPLLSSAVDQPSPLASGRLSTPDARRSGESVPEPPADGVGE
jgi:glycosyltransferase involved in cell wall biosynthesis